MGKIKIRLMSLFPQIKVTTYIEHNKKHLVIYKVWFGHLIWSRHFRADLLPYKGRNQLDKGGMKMFQIFM